MLASSTTDLSARCSDEVGGGNVQRLSTRAVFPIALIFEKLSSGQCDTLLQKSEQTDRSSSGVARTLRLSVSCHRRR